MKVELVQDCEHGSVGQILSDPDCWRLCFPMNGCVAKPVDAKALARVRRDLESTDELTRLRLIGQMAKNGTSRTC